MNTEQILEQLEMFNKSYEWVIDEADKVQKQIFKMKKSDYGSKKYYLLSKQLDELQNRYNSNKVKYNEIVSEVRKYFEDKHNLDILDFIKDENN